MHGALLHCRKYRLGQQFFHLNLQDVSYHKLTLPVRVLQSTGRSKTFSLGIMPLSRIVSYFIASSQIASFAHEWKFNLFIPHKPFPRIFSRFTKSSWQVTKSFHFLLLPTKTARAFPLNCEKCAGFPVIIDRFVRCPPLRFWAAETAPSSRTSCLLLSPLHCRRISPRYNECS